MEQEKKKEKKSVVTLEEKWAVIGLPENAVKVELIVTFFDSEDDKLCKCSKALSMKEIKDAFRKAEDYIDEDDEFVFTEKGKELLQMFENDR